MNEDIEMRKENLAILIFLLLMSFAFGILVASALNLGDRGESQLSRVLSFFEIFSNASNDDIATSIVGSIDRLAFFGIIVQTYLAVIVSFGAVALVFIQRSWQKRYDEEMERLEREIKVNVKEIAESEVDRIADKQFRNYVLKYLASYVEEILMQSPQARMSLMARLRRFINFVSENLGDLEARLNLGLTDELRILVQDWYTLQQLFSGTREEIQSGLLKVKAEPFQEARPRLKKLQERYKGNLNLFPMIIDAIRAIDEQDR